MTNIRSKPRQIKPWPEMVGLLPLLKAADAAPKSAHAKVHLDLSQVTAIDAIGSSIVLSRVAQILRNDSYVLTHTLPESKSVLLALGKLHFIEHLAELGFHTAIEDDLFSRVEKMNSKTSDNDSSSSHIKEEFIYEQVISVIPSATTSRENLLKKLKQEVKAFFRNDKNRTFAHEQMMIVLQELTKNTIDHSQSPAFIGMRFSGGNGGPGKFSFIYCDTGIGICHSVRKHMDQLSNNVTDAGLPISQLFQMARLAKKGSFADLIHWALQPGNSTKSGNGVNFGLGLMMIIEASRLGGFRLSVRDADSSMTLTKLSTYETKNVTNSPYSHSQIRQLGVNTCSAPILLFHGEMESE